MVKDEFLRELGKLLNAEEMDAYTEQMRLDARRAFRINVLKTDEEEMRKVLPFEWEKNPYADNSWYLPGDVKPSSLIAWHTGLFYVQEPSASVAVSVLKPEEHERVLDLCAAPGSKTTQILERTGARGFLAANEYDPSRCGILAENIEKHGADNTLVLNADTRDVADAFPSFFDAVLCDAPCSGEGMFRKDSAAAEMWSVDNVLMCARRQGYILGQAYRALKPGGVLVYSTCTLNETENEGVVLSFLEKHPDMEIDPIEGEYPGMFRRNKIEGVLRILPNAFGEGHFVCRMRKREDSSFTPGRIKVRSSKIDPAALSFLKETLEEPFPYVYQNKDRVFVSSVPLYESGRCRIVRYGTAGGEMIRGRFEPAHGLAVSVNASWKYTAELSETEVKEYLAGMQLGLKREKGWLRAAYGHHPAGLVKSDGSVLKNKYPKRLRIKLD